MLKPNDTIRRLQIAKPVLAALFFTTILWAALAHGRAADATERPAATTTGRLAAAPARLLPPAVGPFQVDDSPVITVTKEDQFPGASAEPGETITYTIVVTNESITDALGVTLSDTIDLHTNFVDGSLRASPMAADDAYDTVGNTRIAITPTNGLLANDVDPDDPAPNPAFNDGLTIVLSDMISANGGDVSVSPDGSFTYDPPAGFEGVDTFTYTIEDGHGLTDVGEVTITVSDVIWYVDHTAASGGDGRSHSPFDTVAAFNSSSLDETGDVIFLYEQGGGPYDNGVTLLDNQQLVGQGVDLITTVGLTPPLGATFPGVTSNPTLNNTTADNGSHGVILAQNNALHGLNVGDTGGAGITGANFGALAVSAASVTGSGAILDLNTGALDAAFDALSTTSSATAGVSLTGVDGDLTAGGGSIAGATGTAFHVNGGTVAVIYPGSITQSAAARIVQVQNRPGGAGTVTFSGNLTCDTSCTGVNVAGNSGGAVNFSGGSKRLDTGANTAVTFSNNTGAGLLFTNGGLDVDTTSGDGINAIDGGAITVVGSGNHVNTITGAGINVVNTAIGAAGMIFESISVNGATNGIVLDNTGSSGGLTVTGNGGACTIAMPTCTGGRIQSTTGADGAVAGSGVYLADTGPVSLSFIRIDNHPNYAIFGDTVNGFSLIDSVVDGNNGNNDELDEGSIRFNDLFGSGAITRSDISGGHEDNLRIVNETSTLDRLLITDSSFHDNSDLLGNDGILLESRNSAVVNVTVNGTSFSAHRGDHFDANATDNSTLDVIFTNNKMTGGHPNALGQTFILSNGGSAEVTFQVEDNSINGAILSAFTFFQSAATTASSSLIGTFSGNTVGTTGVNGSGSAQGNGAVVNAAGDGTVTILADNNEIRQWSNGHGFLVQAGDGSPVVNATISNSTITEPNTDLFPLNGLHLNAGTTSAGAATVCLDIQGTDMVDAGAFGADDFRLRQRNNSTVNLPGYGGSNSDTGAVVTFVQNNNIGAPTGSATVSGSGGGFTGSGSSCSTPSVANGGEDPDLSRELLVISDWSRSISERAEPVPLDLLTLEDPRTIDSSSRSASAPDSVSQHLIGIAVPGRLAKPLAAPAASPTLATPGDTTTLLADPFTLPGRETFTVTFAVTIATPLPAGVDSVQNQAAVTGSNFDDVLSVDPDPHADFPPVNGETVTPINAAPDLSLAKDDGGISAAAHETVTYTLTYSNTGTQHASGVVITETVPAHTTFNPGASSAGWSCAPDGSAGSACILAVANVDAGDPPATVALAVDVAGSVPAGTTQISNTADIGDDGSGGNDPTPADNTATDTTPLITADLVVSKSDNPDPAVAGEMLTYTVTITNNGPSVAQNVVATDTLTDVLALVNTTGCAEDLGGAPTCSLGAVGVGESVSYTLLALVDSSTLADTITNTVSVASAALEAAPGDESATITTTVDAVADLELAKRDTPDPLLAGEPLTFTLVLTNHGPSLAQGVFVTDTLPVTDYTYTGNDCGATFSSPTLDWTIGDAPAGSVFTCVITGTVNAGVSGTITNTAHAGLAASIADPDLSNNSVEEPTAVFDNLFTIGDVAQSEADGGTTAFTFTVSRTSTASAGAVDYATAGDTAAAGQDYTATSGTVNFAAAGSLTQTVTVDVHGDGVVELDETFFVNLSNPAGGGIGDGQGLGTIMNDDSATLSIGDVSQNEGDSGTSSFVFSVTLSAAVDTAVALDYATADDTATTADGDYTPVSGALSFSGAAGETQTVAVDVHGDATVEPDETFHVDLSNVSAAGRDVTLADGRGTGTILNDDGITALAYLPVVQAPAPVYPDLVVDELSGGDEIRVVIRNQGAALVADAFWVDLYVDPDRPPAAVNETWTTVGDYGAVWGVGADALPLLPGEALTLTLGDAYYEPALSLLPATIASGTPLYAQVDSANAETDYGAVLETHEAAGAPYNNIAGPVTMSVSVAVPGAASSAPGRNPAALPLRLLLPD